MFGVHGCIAEREREKELHGCPDKVPADTCSISATLRCCAYRARRCAGREILSVRVSCFVRWKDPAPAYALS